TALKRVVATAAVEHVPSLSAAEVIGSVPAVERESMLGELRENASPPEGLEEKLDRLIDMPDQRLEFLALRIQSALRRREPVIAMTRALEFSSILSNLTPIGNEDEQILRDPARSCDLNNWLAARIAEVVELAGQSDQLQVIQDQLDQRAAIVRASSSKSLASFVRQFKPLDVSALQLVLADRQQIEGRMVAAERALFGRQPSSDWLNAPADAAEDVSTVQPAIAERLIALAELYQQAGLDENAASVAGLIARADASLPDFMTDKAKEILQKTERAIPSQRVDGDVGVSLTWQSRPSPMGVRSTSIAMVFPAIQAGKSFSGWKIVNRSPGVVLQNPFGNASQLSTISGFRSRRTLERSMVLSGGVLFLQRPGELTAVDLFALSQNRIGDAILWTRDFGSEEAIVSSRSTETTTFGDSIPSFPIAAKVGAVAGEFRVGAVQGDQLYVLLSGELIAIDAATGETLWRNSAAPATGMMVADEQHVAVVNYKRSTASEISVFDRYDGRLIESRPWTYGKPWAVSTGNLLCYQESDDACSATVRLVDPLKDALLLELEDAAIRNPRRDMKPKGMGRILQQRWMILFDSLGRLTVWDLLQGRELVRQTMDEMENLTSLNAMLVEGQVLVLPANDLERGRGSYTTQHGQVHQTANRIYAVSTETGEIRWQREFDPAWGISIDQPYSSPVAILVRSRSNQTIERNGTKMDVMMLRLSDGESIHEELDREVAPSSTGLTTFQVYEPLTTRIRAKIAGEDLEYRISEPSEPAEDTGDEKNDPESEFEEIDGNES
ncbi:MAG: PQQ-binding-like beta-propeller repeat protein, partial [Planctomycetota bacterium]